jgi:hypothetical protein
VLFHCIDYHPHTYQLSFQCLYLPKNLVFRFAKVNSSPLTHPVELGVIWLLTKWQEKPADVIASTQVILLKIFRASAEALLWTVWTSIARWLFHAAPPEKKR